MIYRAISTLLFVAEVMAIPTLVAFLASGRRRFRRHWASWAIGIGLTLFILTAPYMILVIGWFGLADAINHK